MAAPTDAPLLALITDDRFAEHATPPWHPESPARLGAIMAALARRGALDHPALLRLAPRLATDAELAAVHTAEHIATVDAAARRATADEPFALDPDTFVSTRSAEIARLAAGAALVGVDAVMTGQARRAFALARPPGHHAEPNRAMGFCLFNTIAVAARYAQRAYGVGRVLIVDYDVHHGNGTQAAVYDDPTIAYFSSHQSPFYPGTGAFDELGGAAAPHTNANAPLPRDATLELYDAVYREVFLPFADRFKPDLILLSAGYDAHWRDPLANMLLDVAGLTLLTHRVREAADLLCGGRMVAVLEGGYDLEALGESVAGSVAYLLGEPRTPDSVGEPPWPGFRWNADAVLEELRRVQDLAGYRRKPRPAGPIPGQNLL